MTLAPSAAAKKSNFRRKKKKEKKFFKIAQNKNDRTIVESEDVKKRKTQGNVMDGSICGQEHGGERRIMKQSQFL